MICPRIIRVSNPIEFELERKFPGPCKTASKLGEPVDPESVVAHCEVSAGQRLIKIAHELGVSGRDTKKYLLRKIGDRIYRGEIIARRHQILGLGKKEIRSPADGVISDVDNNGDLLVKFLPTMVKLVAGAKGAVSRVGQEAIFIKSVGRQIRGFAGEGREREGVIKVIASPEDFLIPQKITADCAGKIIVGGSLLERSTIEKALTLGVHGIVVGGINQRDFLSLGIGSDVGISVLVTEGFGGIPMGRDIFEILKKFEGRFAFVSGEAKSFFVPEVDAPPVPLQASPWKELAVGDMVKFLKTNMTDFLGQVSQVSTGEEVLNSGLLGQTASVKFPSGKTVTTAAANLEIVS